MYCVTPVMTLVGECPGQIPGSHPSRERKSMEDYPGNNMEDPTLRVPAPQPRQASREASPGRPARDREAPTKSKSAETLEGQFWEFWTCCEDTVTVHGRDSGDTSVGEMLGLCVRLGTFSVLLNGPVPGGSRAVRGRRGCGTPSLGAVLAGIPSTARHPPSSAWFDVWGSLHSAYFSNI